MHKINIDIEQLKEYITNNPDKNLSDIAEYFECSISSIKKIFLTTNKSFVVKKEKINITKLKEYIANNPTKRLYEIAEVFECSDSYIKNKIKQYGISFDNGCKIGKGSKAKIDLDLFDMLVKSNPNISISELMEKTKCSRGSAYRLLKERNLLNDREQAFVVYVKLRPNNVQVFETHCKLKNTTMSKEVEDILNKLINEKEVTIKLKTDNKL